MPHRNNKVYVRTYMHTPIPPPAAAPAAAATASPVYSDSRFVSRRPSSFPLPALFPALPPSSFPFYSAVFVFCVLCPVSMFYVLFLFLLLCVLRLCGCVSVLRWTFFLAVPVRLLLSIILPSLPPAATSIFISTPPAHALPTSKLPPNSLTWARASVTVLSYAARPYIPFLLASSPSSPQTFPPSSTPPLSTLYTLYTASVLYTHSPF
ncbi:hypothetical protein K439DRAFT_97907 [Ramaria rubella]|nr:hypothetical protein K439DRAFT_97907 [Ramaria rubella]